MNAIASGRLGPFVIRELMNAGHEVVLFSHRPVAEEFSHLSIILKGEVNIEYVLGNGELRTVDTLVEVDVDNPTGLLLPGAYVSVHLRLAAPVRAVFRACRFIRAAGRQPKSSRARGPAAASPAVSWVRVSFTVAAFITRSP